MHWRVLPVISIVLNAVALLLLIVSFSTEYWVQYDVDRDTLQQIAVSDATLQTHLDSSAYYEDRHKGLFHVCYTGDTFDKCVKRTGYEMGDLSSDLSSDDRPSTYTTRIHLMRACLITLSMGILSLFLSLLFVVIGTAAKKAVLFRVACACATIACFAIALGMAVFHGVEYLEKKKLTELPEFPAAWMVTRQHFTLNSNIEITFGFSMYLGWLSLVLTIVIAILTMWTGVNIPLNSYNDEKRLTNGVAEKDESFYSSTLARNRAYDIVEGKDNGGDDDGDDDAGDFDKEIFSGNDIFIGMDKPPAKQRF